MWFEEKNIGHAMVESNNKTKCSESIVIKRLDEYLEKSGPVPIIPYLIKVDTEGYEYQALKTAKDFFKKHKAPKHIFTEYATNHFHYTGTDPKEYLDFLLVDLEMIVELDGKIIERGNELYNHVSTSVDLFDLHAYRP
jgi:hypothetical protein